MACMVGSFDCCDDALYLHLRLAACCQQLVYDQSTCIFQGVSVYLAVSGVKSEYGRNTVLPSYLQTGRPAPRARVFIAVCVCVQINRLCDAERKATVEVLHEHTQNTNSATD